MKKATALMLGLILVLLILTGVGIYYYLNVTGKIAPAATTMISPPGGGTQSGRLTEPTVTPPVEEELNNLNVATDDADLQDLNKDLQGL